MANLSSATIGLSLLSGTNAFATQAENAAKVESRAVRTARAAFTTKATTAPWQAKTSAAAESVELSRVKSMRTIIDPKTGSVDDPDVQTSFTTYKALDRLRLLADAAAKETTSSAERVKLEAVFAKGLADLKAYLAKAPSELLDISYARNARQAQTVGVAVPSSLTKPGIAGKPVLDARNTAIPGMTGQERLRIDLSGNGRRDSVTVDLSTSTQPPTLDSVAEAINTAIRSVELRDIDGQVVRDANGEPTPRYAITATPTKTGEKWGLNLARSGFETIAIDQIGGGDAILVASGTTATEGETAGLVSRIDDPDGTMTRKTLGTIAATDGDATERLAIAAEADSTKKIKAKTVAADLGVRAVAVDSEGFSYVVGTTAGDLGSNLSDGDDDLFLTKLDSEGKTMWRRTLGVVGTATGAAVTIAPDGGIVVAGTVSGSVDGTNSDGDMLVARYDTRGEESFATLVRAVGADSASAVTVASDGAIFVGGSTASGGGDAVITRFDAQGKLAERRVFGGAGADAVRALAIAGDGALLVLTSEAGSATLRRTDRAALATDLATLSLGTADARAIAVAADGSIAVAGATDGALSGAQVNTRSTGRDAFVARIDAGLSGSAVTYLGTVAEDQADSVAYLGGRIYVGGRTAGALDGGKTGTVDAFAARLDATSGAVEDISQFGAIDVRYEPVRIAAVAGGDTVLGALGLARGTLTPTDAVTLPAQTGLRAGDEFSIRINGGASRKVTIAKGDTLTTLADRVRTLVGIRVATVTTPASGGGRALRIETKPGTEIELIAGASGKDALHKLGLEERRIATPADPGKDAPTIRPGGAYALDLTDALRIDTKADAKITLERVKQAISTSQSAYRSLYWDDGKAERVDAPAGNGKRAGSTVVEQAQLANYQAALSRLSGS